MKFSHSLCFQLALATGAFSSLSLASCAFSSGAASGDAPLRDTDGFGDEDGFDAAGYGGLGGSSADEEMGALSGGPTGPSLGEPTEPEDVVQERRERDSDCVRVLSLGQVAQAGTVPGGDGMDAIVHFLNEESTARADYLPEKPVLNDALLFDYDLVLLQNLAGWEFAADELDSLKDWVAQGGSIMALAGYTGDAVEILPTNELLSFTGLNYVGLSSYGDTAADIGECGYCLGTTHPQRGWNPDHPIARGISAVGAYQGRSINGAGEVVAAEDGLNLGLTVEIGAGRVFLFHDEWVTYASQWNGESRVMCEDNASCSDVTIQSTYQMHQFWFNSIYWLAHEAECFELSGALLPSELEKESESAPQD